MFNGFYGCDCSGYYYYYYCNNNVCLCIYLFTNPTAYNPITRSPHRQKGTSKREQTKKKQNRLTQQEIVSIA